MSPTLGAMEEQLFNDNDEESNYIPTLRRNRDKSPPLESEEEITGENNGYESEEFGTPAKRQRIENSFDTEDLELRAIRDARNAKNAIGGRQVISSNK